MFINQHNHSFRAHDDHDAAAGSSPSPMDGIAALVQVSNMVPSANEPTTNSAKVGEETELQPYPFFYYRDHSRDADPDPLYPLVPPGRVPNFAAKMHAILSRPDLQDIISWMPHGRSWRVLKPRDFEVRVIPQYFDQTKYTSFVRQANGWGFRRITQGRDQGSYYHPKFLRGMPHLCKTMKRLVKSSKKRAIDPTREPDLFKISELYPLPEEAQDESIMLSCTVQGGPKARMPVCDGSRAFQKAQAMNAPLARHTSKDEFSQIAPKETTLPTSPTTVPTKVVSPPVSPGATAPMFRPATPPSPQAQMPCSPEKQAQAPPAPFLSTSLPLTSMLMPPASLYAAYPYAPSGMVMMPPMAAFPGTQPADSDAAASFAAGFAAATAFSHQHFSKLMRSISAANEATKATV